MPKIPRNDPCPCGSGKKFKKCCVNRSDGTPIDGHEYLSKMFHHGVDGMRRGVAEELRQHGRTERFIYEIADGALGFAEMIIAKMAENAKPACRAGCSYCCYVPVEVTAPEVFELARAIRETAWRLSLR